MIDTHTRNALVKFLAKAGGANIEDPKVFTSLIKEGIRILEVRPREVARAFHVSLAHAVRWINGTTLPERILRPRILNLLLVRARAQIGDPTVATAT